MYVHEGARKLRGWNPAATYCWTDFTVSVRSVEISTKRIGAAVAGMRSNSRLHLSANELLIETDHVKFVTAELDKRGGP
jgi:hypothetical protein